MRSPSFTGNRGQSTRKQHKDAPVTFEILLSVIVQEYKDNATVVRVNDTGTGIYHELRCYTRRCSADNNVEEGGHTESTSRGYTTIGAGGDSDGELGVYESLAVGRDGRLLCTGGAWVITCIVKVVDRTDLYKS